MKSESPPTTIDAYISGFPEDVQEILQKIRRIIGDAAPEAEEAIKYRIPTFVLGENLVHFAAFAKHIGFYPTPSGIEQFKDALSVYNSAKGSVQFPLDLPIPYNLIKRIVKFRVSESLDKNSSMSKGTFGLKTSKQSHKTAKLEQRKGMKRKATQNNASNSLGQLKDGAKCKVVEGTHKGKNGMVRDINTSKTGHVTITVVQSNGERFKTLAKNVVVQ